MLDKVLLSQNVGDDWLTHTPDVYKDGEFLHRLAEELSGLGFGSSVSPKPSQFASFDPGLEFD